jgi:DNA-binding IscR family transcriptional regulator
MDTRFAIAIHLLVLVHSPSWRGATAERLARSVGTHPVRVRRLLGALAQSGLLETRRGRNGGTFPTCAPETITLSDVHHAVYDAVYHDPDILPMHAPPSPHCPVGSVISLALLAPFARASYALRQSLAETTIAEVAAEVAQSSASRRPRR